MGRSIQSIGDAPASWIDTDDVELVAATVLRSPRSHYGKTYSLAVESRTFSELQEDS